MMHMSPRLSEREVFHLTSNIYEIKFIIVVSLLSTWRKNGLITNLHNEL